ncbi:hypothetical protein QBC38DRAFT_485835 [Podospora fimiseda]|uniref:Ubiquitin 3 binding protein But2 C-terminal domain-containing protein n=1 Tax=Podospora fimiseda TaxID=252190 RepID=A0AAN7GX11_9PEZI|nr:hypothetical protein QBC38DRAFT_485835 [Podospora fimiseda]
MLPKASTLLLALTAIASAAEANRDHDDDHRPGHGDRGRDRDGWLSDDDNAYWSDGGGWWNDDLDGLNNPSIPPFTLPITIPDLFPVREVQPRTVIAHSANNRWDNQCTNPVLNERNYVYQYSTGFGQTLLHIFQFPEEVRGRTCWLELHVQNPTWNTASPTVQVNVFRTTQLPICTGRSRQNFRGASVGRLNVPTNGIALWARTDTAEWTSKRPCPVPGTEVGFEFAIEGTNAGFSYPQRTGVGVRVLYE